MKKLKIKVSTTIFIILTSCVLIIITALLVGSYSERKNRVTEILRNISKSLDAPLEINEPPNIDISDKNIKKIYLDFTIYTVILDDNGNYKEVINHTEDESFDEKNIKKVAENIISNHTSTFFVGNLYTDKYAYTYTDNNSLIIMDNTNINNYFLKQLITYINILIICEIIIFIITYLLTKWITTPVKRAFLKQKTFIADASHELKTPLSVMIASTDAYFNDKNDKWIYNIKNESERMIKLVTELLDLAKTEKEQDIEMCEHNLSEIIESSVLTFESVFYEKKIKLKYKIEDNISLWCNEELIMELMNILIDNAIKHSSLKGEININLYKRNKQIVLEVINKGLPIKKEDEEKIFERFYKVDSSRNRNSNNYGLGLAIAKNIVTKHKGKISACSSNDYTTFKVIWNQK